MRRSILTILASLAILTATPADSNAVGTDLAGLWHAGESDRPAFAGTIRVVESNGGWTAVAGAHRATGRPSRGGVSFPFTTRVGELWAVFPGSGVIQGLWSQPGSPIDSFAYATPVKLTPSHAETWAGMVVPYVPRYDLYLCFARRTDGSLGGFLRDPIGDFGTMAPFDSVSISGDDVVIRTRANVFSGSIDPSKDILKLGIGKGLPVVFRRVNRDQAAGFYPTPRSGSGAAFAGPAALEDGWTVGTPAGVHIDPSRLQALAAYLAAQTPTLASPRTPYIQSLLVARDDRLVVERYYFGFDRNRQHDVRSAGKSLDTALFGVAANQAPTLAVDTAAERWLPYKSYAHPDPRKRRITVGDFFDMTSGLDCDDNNDDSLGNEDTMQSQTAQPDWYKYTMDLPLVGDPGTPKAVYCSAGLNMIGAIIVGATHQWTPALFERMLAGPLQFGTHHLQLTQTGEMYLGGGSYFLPRDFLKLGELFLDRGSWNGRRIVSQAWVAEALQPHSGLTQPNDYGYGWHLTTYQVGSARYDAFEAQGNGGQLVVVVPRLSLVVGIMAANYGDYRTWAKFHDLIANYIVAACR